MPAPAEDSDPLASAEDAFGSSSGRESIGIYSPRDVRGFSPFVAGNVRFDGVYVDAVSYPIILLVSGASVRVGTSAQSFPFPAPSGIADFRLREPARKQEVRGILAANAFGTRNVEIDLSTPVSDRLFAFASGFAGHDDLPTGASGDYYAGSAALRWAPSSRLGVKAFWSTILRRRELAAPLVVLGSGQEPPRIARRRYYGQDWTLGKGQNGNYGATFRYQAGALTVSGGAFRSILATDRSFVDLFDGVDKDGLAARHLIVANPAQKATSTSGEVRADLPFKTGRATHALTASVWGRDQRRIYGGGVPRNFGPARVGERVAVEPFGPGASGTSDDDIGQISAGLAYRAVLPEVGGLTLGARRSDYRKNTLAPGRPIIASRDASILLNAAGNVQLSPRAMLFGSYSQGLEESAVAPDSAVNRNEAPPAVRTAQIDFGTRANLGAIVLNAAVFQIEKPYFNLDETSVYRELGQVRHRGMEFSVSGDPARQLTLLLGGVLLDAKVTGPAVTSGRVGPQAVAVPRTRLTFTGEYRPMSTPGFSIDVNAQHTGRSAANTANTRFAREITSIDLGARYRWSTSGRMMSLRAQVTNVLNGFRWLPQASDTFSYVSPRNVSLRLTMEG